MILFCEYQVPDLHREAFLAWVQTRKRLWDGVKLMENEDQPGVFVEIWPARDAAEADRIRKERLDGRSEWKEMEEWIKGGRKGLRIWIFRPVSPDG